MNRFEDNRMVSVIIPIYNSEKYIEETIESVLNQTYTNFEIIIVDDCSSDKSGIIARQYKEVHSNIKYVLQEKNEGVAVARNKGISIAKGRYIAFLDSDDIWDINKLSKQLEFMDKKNAKLSFTAIEMIDENGNLLKEKREVKEIIDYNFLLKNTMIPTSSVIVDRSISGEFNMTLRRSGQDYSTWLKLLRDGDLAYGINEALVKYRIRNNSLSSKKLKSIRQVWDIQTKDENINKINAYINILFFIINAVKKYVF